MRHTKQLLLGLWGLFALFVAESCSQHSSHPVAKGIDDKLAQTGSAASGVHPPGDGCAGRDYPHFIKQ